MGDVIDLASRRKQAPAMHVVVGRSATDDCVYLAICDTEEEDSVGFVAALSTKAAKELAKTLRQTVKEIESA